MRECDKAILDVIDLSAKLLFCADRGDLKRSDDSCGVLFGTVRDCAYRLLDLARRERELHIMKGTWGLGKEQQVNN
ncbi:MAG: hypothetical protein JXA18_13515 [Chitinispirillaceae bacterium]|nr:hypothetical protein [Chitinispirillaceae bacterium]